MSDADGTPAADGPNPAPRECVTPWPRRTRRGGVSPANGAGRSGRRRFSRSSWCWLPALRYMAGSEPRVTVVNEEHPGYTYFLVFLMIALDAVMPIFPGETTLNAASTARRERQPRPAADHRRGRDRRDRRRLVAVLDRPQVLPPHRAPARRGRRRRAGPHRAGLHEQERPGADHRRALRAGHALRRQRHHGPVRDPLPPLPAVVRRERRPLERRTPACWPTDRARAAVSTRWRRSSSPAW